jgi:hypothetical protein
MYKAKKGIKGNGLVDDIISKGRSWILDKAHQAIKEKKIISRGLAGLSLANPSLAPITGPLSALSGVLGYGLPKKKKMKKMKLIKVDKNIMMI